jgi:hypothetical protein
MSDSPAEPFRTLPSNAEDFRTVPSDTERKESHSLTVREVAWMFEAAGVPRTERSITNWCHPNRLGVSRLDSYYDPNDRKYFITPQSVELAVKEEQVKTAHTAQERASFGTLPKRSETKNGNSGLKMEDSEAINDTSLERQLRDLKITNEAKDYYIERLEKEREGFIEKLILTSHRVGELEAKLLQLESPRSGNATENPSAVEREAPNFA